MECVERKEGSGCVLVSLKASLVCSCEGFAVERGSGLAGKDKEGIDCFVGKRFSCFLTGAVRHTLTRGEATGGRVF